MPQQSAALKLLRSVIGSMVDAVGEKTVGDTFTDCCDSLCKHSETVAAAGTATSATAIGLGAGAVTAGTGGLALIPVALGLTLFGISVWARVVKEKREGREAEEARAAIAEVVAGVRAVLAKQSNASEDLEAIVTRRSPVWARLSGADQADLARRVGEAMQPTLELLGTNIHETLAQHWILNDDTNRRVRSMETVLLRLAGGSRLLTVLEDLAPRIGGIAPARNARFTGREEEIADIHKKLNEGGKVGVTQQAATFAHGGVGKTAIATEYAWRCVDPSDPLHGVYPGGVFWISADADSILPAMASLASGLGITGDLKPEEAAAKVKDHLQSHAVCLLVLDNVRGDNQWRDKAFQALLPGNQCHRLATTRSDRLGDVTMKHIERLPVEIGVTLLAKYRADASAEANKAEAAKVVEWFDGLAIGVVVAGAYMALNTGVSWAGLRASLERKGLGAARAAQNAAGAPIDYERRVDEVFDQTLDSLPAPQRRALEYAALLIEDAFPKLWLEFLLTSDAEIVLEDLPGYEGRTCEPVLARLIALDLLRSADGSSGFVALHRVLRRRLLERAQAAPESTSALLDRVIKLAESRGEASHDAVAGNLHEPDEAKRQADVAALRAELTPLVVLAGSLAEHGRFAAGVSLASWCNTPLRDLGRFSESHASLTRFAVDPEALLEQAGPQSAARLHANLALSQSDQGDLRTARASVERAIAIAEKYLGAEHPDLATMGSNLALIQQDQGDLPGAQVSMERAIHIVEKHFGPEHSKSATMRSNLALIQQDQGDLTGARASMLRAIEIKQKHFPPDHPTFATSYSNLAVIQQDQGDLPGALASLQRAIDIDQKHFAPDHPTFATKYSNLGAIQHAQKNLSGARASLERAIDISQKHFAPDHPNLAALRSNLSVIQQSQGDLLGARANLEQAIAIEQKHFPPDHPTIAFRYSILATIQLAHGDLPGARASVTRAIAIEHRHFASDHPRLGANWGILATIDYAQGDKAAACANFKKELAILLKHVGEDHPETKSTRAWMKKLGCTE